MASAGDCRRDLVIQFPGCGVGLECLYIRYLRKYDGMEAIIEVPPMLHRGAENLQ
jgi:hypothetical protein